MRGRQNVSLRGRLMGGMRRAVLVAVTASFLFAVPGSALADYDDRYDDGPHYTFATTRGLSEMDVHPAFKVTVLPLTVVADLAFLPFALLADAMN